MENKAIQYIPSKFSYTQVKKILQTSEKSATDNFRNKKYVQLSFLRLMCSVEMIFVFYFGAWIFKDEIIYLSKSLTVFYLRPFIKVNAEFNTIDVIVNAIPVIAFFFLFIININVMNLIKNQISNIFYKKGDVICNKYRKKSEQISNVYEEMDRFIKYIELNPELKADEFKLNASKSEIYRLVPHMNGDEKITFYFGPYLKEIIKDRSTLDFSKLDFCYKLINPESSKN